MNTAEITDVEKLAEALRAMLPRDKFSITSTHGASGLGQWLCIKHGHSATVSYENQPGNKFAQTRSWGGSTSEMPVVVTANEALDYWRALLAH